MLRSSLVALAIAFVFASAAHADETTADGIAALVGNDIVLVSEVLARVAPIETRMREQGAPKVEIAKLRAAGLEKLIEARLVDQIVARGELYATEDEIAKTIDGIATENGITVDELERSVVAQGMTLEQYKQEIKTGIEHQKVIRGAIASQIEVTESEVRALYTERFANQPAGGEVVHLRQILVTFGAVPLENRAATCRPVHKAAKRIAAGEAFEKVASEVSEVAPAKGGDIGWLHYDTIANWMSGVIDPLEDGDSSPVIELPFGCSILKLVERREFEPVRYEDAENELSLEIYQRQLDAKFHEWLEVLREQTYIERKGHFADAAMLGSHSGFSDPEADEEGADF